MKNGDITVVGCFRGKIKISEGRDGRQRARGTLLGVTNGLCFNTLVLLVSGDIGLKRRPSVRLDIHHALFIYSMLRCFDAIQYMQEFDQK
jgi:hypothetical protein